VIHPRNVTEFSYRYSDPTDALIYMSFHVSSHEKEVPQIIETLKGNHVSLFFTNTMCFIQFIITHYLIFIDFILFFCTENNMKALDITDNEMAKSHARYFAGGRSPAVLHERLYRFEFPERPNALSKFLSSLHTNWNVSLFHYRNHGGDVGKVLVGIQVPEQDMADFQSFLKTLNYPYVDESENPVYKQFLK